MPESWLEFLFISTKLYVLRNNFLPKVYVAPCVLKFPSELVQHKIQIQEAGGEVKTLHKTLTALMQLLLVSEAARLH